jgi:hypothetical protein
MERCLACTQHRQVWGISEVAETCGLSCEGLWRALESINEKAHSLTRATIQMCDNCHRFFIISYEKNEKGEVVEIGHELDIRIKASGVVRVDEGEDQRSFERNSSARRKFEEESCW